MAAACDSLLVRPVFRAGVTQASVYFPGKDVIWYHIDTYQSYRHGTSNVASDLATIPVFYKGGSIVPRKLRVRRSLPLMKNDPYTLYVALDSNDQASGHLYVDDGETIRHHLQQDSSAYMKYKFAGNTLSSDFASNTRFYTPAWHERIAIIGVKSGQYKATLVQENSESPLEVRHHPTTNTLTIRKPGVPIATKWMIKIK